MKAISIILRLVHYLKNPLRKNAIFLIISEILLALFGFIFWWIAKHFAEGHLANPDDEVGLAAALVSAVLLLQSLSKLGCDIGLARFLHNAENRQYMINTCLTLVGLLSVLLATICILGFGGWSSALSLVRENTNYTLLFILFTGAVSLFGQLQQGVFVAFRSTKFSLAMQTVAGLRLLLPAFLISYGAFGIFSSWGIAICIACIMGILLIRRLQPGYRPIPGIKKKIVTEMMGFSLGNYVAESFRELPGLLLPLLIVDILAPDMGYYFYIAWTIANSIFMIVYSTNFSLLAEVSYQREKLRSDVLRSLKFIFLLLIPVIIFIFVFGDMLLSIFGEACSEEAFTLLRILALSAIPLVFNALYITIKRIRKDIKPVIYIHSFIALFTIGIGCVLMNEMELVGIGIAWISSQSAVTFVIAIAMIRKWVKGL